MVGQHRLGDAQGLEHLGVPARAVAVDEAGHAGVGGVGDVERARPRGSTPPRCRRCRRPARPARPARGRGRRRRGGRPAWWPRRWGPAGCPGPGARGRCRPSAGPASRARGPPARRWPGPTRWSTPAGWRCPTAVDRAAVGQAAGGHVQHGGGHGRGVELHQPGEGGVGQDGHVVDVLDGAVGADDGAADPRGADVDDQDAHGQRHRAERAGEPELARVEDAVGVEGLLDRRQHVECRRRGRRAGSGPG